MNFRKLFCPKCSYWKIYVSLSLPKDSVIYKCPKCHVPLEPEDRQPTSAGA
jgi:predicted RNA-binding Zn-ribbon protein involved in translation (DUF1610 family)